MVNSNKAGPETGIPTVSLTTTVDNSAVAVFVVDSNRIDPADHEWLAVADFVRPTIAANLVKTAQRDSDSTGCTVYSAYYHNVGPAGEKVFGLTVPDAQRYTIMAVEIPGLYAYGLACNNELTSRPPECLNSRATLDNAVLGS